MFAEKILKMENGIEKIQEFLSNYRGVDKIAINPTYKPFSDGRLTVYYTFVTKDNKIDEDNSFVFEDSSMDKDVVQFFYELFGKEYKSWRYARLDELFSGIC